jgi:hypothetical protein
MNALHVGLALLSLPFPAWPAQIPAGLVIQKDLRGQADVRLHITRASVPEERARAALNEAFGGELEEVSVDDRRDYWTLRARAPRGFGSGVWARTCEVRLQPLLELLDRADVEGLQVSLTHPRGGFADGPDGSSYEFRFSVAHTAAYTRGSDPPPFRVEFGYHPRDAWRFFPLAVTLALPLFLTARRRRRALAEMETRLETTGVPPVPPASSFLLPPSSFQSDPLAVWFRYWLFQRRLLVALWVVWFLLLGLLDAPQLLWFTLGGMTEKPLFEAVLLALLPPLLVTAVCLYLSRAVYARPPEVRWAANSILARALGPVLVLFGVCVAWGFASEVNNLVGPWVSNLSLPYFAFFPAVYFGISGLWQSATVRNGAPLPEGELRNRVVELGEDFGVPFSQVGALPAATWRLVNVLYPFRAWLFLTPDLVPRLSRREFDAFLAHQFAEAHLVRTRGWWLTPLGVGLGFGVFIALIVAGRIYRLDFARWWPLLLPLPTALLYLARKRLRRLAPRGDVAGAALVGDPQAMLTALHKLQQLRLVPLAVDEPDPPPPGAPWPRLEALATRARIPADRLETLLAEPPTAPDAYPPLPELPGLAPHATGGAETLNFSPALKRRIMTVLVLAYFTLQIGLPTLAAYLGQTGKVSGVWAVLLFLASAVGAFFLLRGLLWVLSVWALRRVRRRLAAKLKEEGTLPDESAALYVGLAPGPAPRIHDGHFIWDLGFLLLTRDHLCYLGDRTRFALPRAFVRSVTLGPGPPDWRRLHQVYLRWEDEEKGEGDTLLLSFAGRRPEEELARRLESWLRDGGAGATVPDLPPPAPIPNTGVRPQVAPTHLYWQGVLFFCALVGTLAGPRVVEEPWPWTMASAYGVMAYVVLDLLHNAPVWFRPLPDGKEPSAAP